MKNTSRHLMSSADRSTSSPEGGDQPWCTPQTQSSTTALCSAGDLTPSVFNVTPASSTPSLPVGTSSVASCVMSIRVWCLRSFVNIRHDRGFGLLLTLSVCFCRNRSPWPRPQLHGTQCVQDDRRRWMCSRIWRWSSPELFHGTVRGRPRPSFGQHHQQGKFSQSLFLVETTPAEAVSCPGYLFQNSFDLNNLKKSYHL